MEGRRGKGRSLNPAKRKSKQWSWYSECLEQCGEKRSEHFLIIMLTQVLFQGLQKTHMYNPKPIFFNLFVNDQILQFI